MKLPPIDLNLQSLLPTPYKHLCCKMITTPRVRGDKIKTINDR